MDLKKCSLLAITIITTYFPPISPQSKPSASAFCKEIRTSHITMKSISFLAYSLLCWSNTQTAAFQSISLPLSRPTVVGQRMAATARSLRDDSNEKNFLLDEFKTASGEIVNPYKLLKVPRDADRTAIRQSYRNLSRVYHPDGALHRTILPGSW